MIARLLKRQKIIAGMIYGPEHNFSGNFAAVL
jgi:hypothetical protein